MTLDLEVNFADAQTVEELAGLMQKFVGQLFASLQKIPNLEVRTDASKPLSSNTPVGTIVFTLSEANILSTAIWNGQQLIDQP